MTLARKTPTIQDVGAVRQRLDCDRQPGSLEPERVSEATRERVSEAVSSTGYTINQAARSLRLRAARTIVIAFPNIGNPFYSTVLDAAVHEASSRGYGALVANRLGDDPTRWLSDYFHSNRADGNGALRRHAPTPTSSTACVRRRASFRWSSPATNWPMRGSIR